MWAARRAESLDAELNLRARAPSAFMLEAGLDAERIPHVLADHRDKDLAESSPAQLSYLRAAGITPAEIIWCWEKFAVFYGAKPLPGEP